MSLNALKFGLNLTDNKKKHLKQLEEKLNDIQKEEVLKSELFPDCSVDKKYIINLENNLILLKESYKKESTKLLEEKIRLITEKSDDLRKNLFNKLSISTKNYEEINPLCTFEEIKK
jgi:hypothetical protein